MGCVIIGLVSCWAGPSIWPSIPAGNRLPPVLVRRAKLPEHGPHGMVAAPAEAASRAPHPRRGHDHRMTRLQAGRLQPSGDGLMSRCGARAPVVWPPSHRREEQCNPTVVRAMAMGAVMVMATGARRLAAHQLAPARCPPINTRTPHPPTLPALLISSSLPRALAFFRDGVRGSWPWAPAR